MLLPRSRHSGKVTMCAADPPDEPFRLMIDAQGDSPLCGLRRSKIPVPVCSVPMCAGDGYSGTVPCLANGGCGEVCSLFSRMFWGWFGF